MGMSMYDGEIDLFDFAQIKRSILGIAEPSGVLKAAHWTVKRDENLICLILLVKRYIL